MTSRDLINNRSTHPTHVHCQPCSTYKTKETPANVFPRNSHLLRHTPPCNLTNTLCLLAGSKILIPPRVIRSTYAFRPSSSPSSNANSIPLGRLTQRLLHLGASGLILTRMMCFLKSTQMSERRSKSAAKGARTPIYPRLLLNRANGLIPWVEAGHLVRASSLTELPAQVDKTIVDE